MTASHSPLHGVRLAFLCLAGIAALPLCADRAQGRSMVLTRHGIVASESPLASQAGAQVLAAGGNAVDAALAANAVMGVVAPAMCGLGGDLFALVYDARTQRLYGLNASGWSPQGLTIEFLRQRAITQMPQSGIHSVTVPGCVSGWERLRARFGRQRFAELLAPAIALAEGGFPLPELTAEAWRGAEARLRQDTNAAALYLPHGHAPAVGEVVRNPVLARTLRRIARGGARAFYRGEPARRIVACSQRLGGTLELEDFAQFQAEWVEPISTTYRGWTVSEIPPNGQGIAALMMLNLMERFPLGEYGHNSADALHVSIEAKKLAYADMLRYVADPGFSRVPVSGLLDKTYAAQRARHLDPARAAPRVDAGDPPPMGTDTTYLCAVDAEGNLVSLIQSNYHSFGSGLVADETGFALQNRGGLFSLDAAHPNALAGRKRPLHTIIPGFMSRGSVRIAFGIMGGWNQSQAHAQFVANLVDYQLNLQAALEAARFTKMTFEGNDVQMESRVPEAVRTALAARGHDLKLLGEFSGTVGGGQAVMRDEATGVNSGASDPRKDGAAIPEPVPLRRANPSAPRPQANRARPTAGRE